VNAWSELGSTLDEQPSAELAMKAGLLAGWNVRKVPMWATLPPVKGISRQVEVTDRVAVVRDNPRTPDLTDYLSIVSHRYQVTQNEAYAEILDQLAEESGSRFAYAGETDGGRCAFLTMRLPGHMHGGVEVYVTALNDHGGYKPFQLLATPVHVDSGAVLVVYEIGRVRHSPSGIVSAFDVARSALDRAFTELDSFQEKTDRLLDTPMTQPRFEQILERYFDAPLGAPQTTRTRARGRRDEQVDLFDGDTAWDAFYAMCDWYDHHSPIRGDTARAYKAVFDPGFKIRALEVLSDV